MALTGVFTVCAVVYLMRTARATSFDIRFAGFLHILMALAMIAMSWPWGMTVPPILYVMVFTAATFFFAHSAYGKPALANAAVATHCWRSNFGGVRLLRWYDAAMMASMVVMAALMASSGSVPQGASAHGTESMAGMSMGAMGSGQSISDSGGWVPTWMLVVAGICAAAYLGAAGVWFYRAVSGPARPVLEMVMAAGMGVSFALML